MCSRLFNLVPIYFKDIFSLSYIEYMRCIPYIPLKSANSDASSCSCSCETNEQAAADVTGHQGGADLEINLVKQEKDSMLNKVQLQTKKDENLGNKSRHVIDSQNVVLQPE